MSLEIITVYLLQIVLTMFREHLFFVKTVVSDAKEKYGKKSCVKDKKYVLEVLHK